MKMKNRPRKGGFPAVLVTVWWCLLLATSNAESGSERRNDGDTHADGGGGGRRNVEANKPHIVLIVADDLGWNDVPWNNKEVRAPHLSSLATDGVLLEQSYVQPVCTPTRSALLGGRYPYTVGRQHGVIRPAAPTGLDLSLTLLPQAMKNQAYSTHAVGKWHLGFCSWAYTPTERGFDSFYGYYTGAEDYYTHTREWSLRAEETTTTPVTQPCNDLHCDDPLIPSLGRKYLDLRNNTTADRNQSGVYSTLLFASQVENLLSTRDSNVPMFLYLPFQSVHAPLQVPDRFLKPYAHIHNHKRRIHLGMVSAMDEAMGRVVTALKNTSHYNNTIIIFTTDNGGPTVSGGNNWPLRGNKSTLWEGGTRGAAFVHSPLLPNPGTSNPTLVHAVDWYPTLVGLAGGATPHKVDGVNQWRAITGQDHSDRSHLIYNIDNTTEFRAGIRMGKYKLLLGNPGPGEWTPPPENTPPPAATPTTPITVPTTATPTTTPTSTPTTPTTATPTVPITTTPTNPTTATPTTTPTVPTTVTPTVPITTTPTTPTTATPTTTPTVPTTATPTVPTKATTPTTSTTTPTAPPTANTSPLQFDENELMGTRIESDITTTRPTTTTTTRPTTTPTTITTGAAASMDEEEVNVVVVDDEEEEEKKHLEEEEGEEEEKDVVLEKCVEARCFGGKISRLVKGMSGRDDIKIRLYDLNRDPLEQHNLGGTNAQVVRVMVKLLHQHMASYTPADYPADSPRANPAHWGGVWSPGWC